MELSAARAEVEGLQVQLQSVKESAKAAAQAAGMDVARLKAAQLAAEAENQRLVTELASREQTLAAVEEAAEAAAARSASASDAATTRFKTEMESVTATHKEQVAMLTEQVSARPCLPGRAAGECLERGGRRPARRPAP